MLGGVMEMSGAIVPHRWEARAAGSHAKVRKKSARRRSSREKEMLFKRMNWDGVDADRVIGSRGWNVLYGNNSHWRIRGAEIELADLSIFSTGHEHLLWIGGRKSQSVSATRVAVENSRWLVSVENCANDSSIGSTRKKNIPIGDIFYSEDIIYMRCGNRLYKDIRLRRENCVKKRHKEEELYHTLRRLLVYKSYMFIFVSSDPDIIPKPSFVNPIELTHP